MIQARNGDENICSKAEIYSVSKWYYCALMIITAIWLSQQVDGCSPKAYLKVRVDTENRWNYDMCASLTGQDTTCGILTPRTHAGVGPLPGADWLHRERQSPPLIVVLSKDDVISFVS